MNWDFRVSFNRTLNWIAIAILSTFIGLTGCFDSSTAPQELRCNNSLNPEAVERIELSWRSAANGRLTLQTAWEIEIASSLKFLKRGEADIWRSGRQLSASQYAIEPDLEFSDGTTYWWRVRVWDQDERVGDWSSPSRFSIGLRDESSWQGRWITYPDAAERALPYFRKSFHLKNKKGVERALLYFSGLGAGELYINGKQVEPDRFLDPAQTNYDQYAFYNAFDVTNLLNRGENVVGVMLGDGWFAQKGAWHKHNFSYGDPMFRLQLNILRDGEQQILLISDEEWEWHEGPVRESNIYLGELYDANYEIDGWSRSDVKPKNWSSAVEAKENLPPKLISQPIPPIRKKALITAKEIWQDSQGNWIFDFGVNLAGVPVLRVEEPKGSEISIRFSEEIDTLRGLDFRSTGWIHHGDIFRDRYICSGSGVEEWTPRFTYHGYRYAELSGISSKPDGETLKLALLYTDLERRGSFDCSSDQLNRLHEMALRTVEGNLHGVPTDCPIREKCGWLGDVHAYVKMANMNYQIENFWLKFLEDIRSGAIVEEDQTLFHERYNNSFYFTAKESGIPYMIAPGKRLCGVASPDWGTALVQLPWWLYIYFGNSTVLSDYYPDMRRWTLYVNSLAKSEERREPYGAKTNSIIYQGLGDWCEPIYRGRKKTAVEFTSTAFHYLDVSIMEQAALLLGKSEDVELFATMRREIAEEMIELMYDKENRTFGTQTADAMALDLGLVPKGDESDVAASIVKNMEKRSEGFISCGIFGLSRIGSMLARHGEPEAAWRIFSKQGENSFEWMWSEADATTMWELLPINSLSHKGALSASYNHPMQTGFDIIFYEDIAGIAPYQQEPGFKTTLFRPLLCDWLDWAKASLDTHYGAVSSSWKKSGDRIEWEIKIPPNSEGVVVPPYKGEFLINGVSSEHYSFLEVTEFEGRVAYRLPAGAFRISTTQH